jgi:hypothetical protein
VLVVVVMDVVGCMGLDMVMDSPPPLKPHCRQEACMVQGVVRTPATCAQKGGGSANCLALR